MLLSGILLLILFCTYNYFARGYDFADPKFQRDILMSFLYGISICGAYYILTVTTFFEDVKSVPFIGWKLALILLILTVVLCIPVFYFLSKVFTVVKAQMGHKSHGKKRKLI